MPTPFLPLIGVGLVVLATLFMEVSSDVGKAEARHHLEGPFTIAFLNVAAAVVLFALSAAARGTWVFQWASLPTFSLRLVLEMAIAYVDGVAVMRASRSTYGFVRVLSLPLVLGVDALLGQQLGTWQLVGIALIIATIAMMASHHGLEKRGLSLCILAAVLAAATISLYKYDITHFNSVEAEQTITYVLVALQLLVTAHVIGRERPLQHLRKPVFIAQSLGYGIGTALASYGYAFAPASVILAAKRSAAVFWSTISGRLYFHERHLAAKAVSLVLIVAGLVLLVV